MKPIYQTIRLDRQSSAPLCRQIKDALTDAIRSGELAYDEMLPPEEELCALWNVSRPTVRQALADLVHEGYLTRVKFKGTFVTRPKLEGKFIQTIQTYDEEIRGMGLSPATRVLSLTRQTADADVCRALKLEEGESVVRLERLRFAQSQPIVHVATYLPESLCGGILNEDMEQHSLYRLLEEKYNISPTRLTRKVQAALPNETVAQLLEMPKDSAILYVSTVAYAQSGAPFEYSLASYRGDRYQMNVDLQKH